MLKVGAPNGSNFTSFNSVWIDEFLGMQSWSSHGTFRWYWHRNSRSNDCVDRDSRDRFGVREFSFGKEKRAISCESVGWVELFHSWVFVSTVLKFELEGRKQHWRHIKDKISSTAIVQCKAYFNEMIIIFPVIVCLHPHNTGPMHTKFGTFLIFSNPPLISGARWLGMAKNN